MTPRSQFLVLTLHGDAILSRTAATAGRPDTLDRVPGASLLGAAAARLYDRLSAEDRFTVFHSGQVRFGDARPLGADGHRTWPVPLAFHWPKGDAWAVSEGGRSWLDGTAVRNLAGAPRTADDPRQWKQMRSGYLTAGFECVAPRTVGILRTAVADDGLARDSFLFGTRAVVRGTRFGAVLSWDPAVSPSLVEQVLDALTTGPVFVGRSRSAEHGAASVARAAVPPGLDAPTETACVQVLVASDLALRDPETGAPCLVPSAASLALPAGWTVDAARSWVRTRAYSPFHGARRRPSLERQVVQAGSVVVLTGDGGALPALEAWAAGGVGDHRAEGLGELVLLPAQWCGTLPAAAPASDPSAASDPAALLQDDPSFQWLAGQHRAHRDRVAAREAGEAWAAALLEYRPRLNRSQWGLLRDEAVRAESDEALLQRLFEGGRTDDAQGLLRSGVRALQQQWGSRRNGETRADRLEALMRSVPTHRREALLACVRAAQVSTSSEAAE